MKLGERIIARRKDKNWTQEKLGNLVAVSKNLMGKYERGEVLPPLDVVIKIAEVLDSSLDYLTGMSDNQPLQKESFPKELILMLTKLEKLSKVERTHIEAVIDAFVDRATLTRK